MLANQCRVEKEEEGWRQDRELTKGGTGTRRAPQSQPPASVASASAPVPSKPAKPKKPRVMVNVGARGESAGQAGQAC